MSFKINIPVDLIAAQMQHVKKELEEDLRLAVKELSVNTRAHIAEQARNGSRKLKTTAGVYIEALEGPKEDSSGNIWVISLDESANWMEDGIKPGTDMKPGLLGGKSSATIPFDHGKNPTQQTETQKNIQIELKAGLAQINKERKANGQTPVNLKKIEKNPDGSPRIGRLHEFDIASSKPTAGAKHPALKGLAIYQSEDKKTGKVRRDILTFRTVSTQSAPDSWIHPGFEGRNFFEEAYNWALQEWESSVLPRVLAKWSGV